MTCCTRPRVVATAGTAKATITAKKLAKKPPWDRSLSASDKQSIDLEAWEETWTQLRMPNARDACQAQNFPSSEVVHMPNAPEHQHCPASDTMRCSDNSKRQTDQAVNVIGLERGC